MHTLRIIKSSGQFDHPEVSSALLFNRDVSWIVYVTFRVICRQ